MYYYNEQECILNAESRVSKPDLFIPEEEDFVVDYFDINCHLAAETCGPGEYIKENNKHPLKIVNFKPFVLLMQLFLKATVLCMLLRVFQVEFLSVLVNVIRWLRRSADHSTMTKNLNCVI